MGMVTGVSASPHLHRRPSTYVNEREEKSLLTESLLNADGKRKTIPKLLTVINGADDTD